MPTTNEMMRYVIDLKGSYGIPFPFTFTVGELVGLSSFYLGGQYCASNLIEGFKGAKDRKAALYAMVPFF